mmetsp:Transcript_108737/g.215934  ORF Transcript_108737/g.215934 Transcript_108737/m.215934 type:complete len:501 (+) Transcript_108737:49-1551(+)
MQPDPESPIHSEPAENDAQAVTYGSCERLCDNRPRNWEENGTLLWLIWEIASESFAKVFLLATLVASLEAGRESFMVCNQEETPQLHNYGEVLLCHYTKAFLFSFPAMATAVLLLLFGRDFLQKRFYYGLLKAGGVTSFSDNTAWRDPFFMAMCSDFAHCIAYSIFHIVILNRAGKEANSIRGFVPQANDTSTRPMEDIAVSNAMSTTAAVKALTTTLAVKGAMMLLYRGPEITGMKHGPPKAPSSAVQAAMMFQKYLRTIMVLVATFLETLLLIIFVYFAYDIASTLVPMSEYLDSYEDKDENPMVSLHSFKDSIAKSILEQSGPQLIAGADGDLHKVYVTIVEKYLQNKNLIRHACAPSPDASQLATPGPEGQPEAEKPDMMNLANLNLANLASISLIRSLWPAELLLRRDIKGRDAKNFRRVWVMYSVLAILWLVHICLVLAVEGSRQIMLLIENQPEQVIPLMILIFHAAGIGITIYVFCESLAPLGFTQELMGLR